MRGDPAIIEALNDVLTAELTAINQYFIHHKMCQNWGYETLSKKKYEESIEEMKHADKVIARILFFDGVPNMQRLSPVSVGENPVEQHEVDLALAAGALAEFCQMTGHHFEQIERFDDARAGNEQQGLASSGR